MQFSNEKYNSLCLNGDLVGAFLYCKECASSENYTDAYACVTLSECYLNGTGTRNDPDKAFKYAKLAAKTQAADGIVQLAKMLYLGVGIACDKLRAVDIYKKMCAKKSLRAYVLLGEHMEGEKKLAAAVKLYRLAEDADCACAYSHIGDMYKNGAIADDNPNQTALLCYMKAARMGLADGYYNVGVCCEMGLGTDCNYEDAARCYGKAIALGDKRSVAALHKMVIDEKVLLSSGETLLIYIKAALLGGYDEKLELAKYIKSAKPNDEDIEFYLDNEAQTNTYAERLLKLAKREGAKELICTELYQSGKGDVKNTDAAIGKLCAQNSPDVEDIKADREMYLLAAKSEGLLSPEEMLEIGKNYRYGAHSLEKSEAKSREWLQLAVNGGSIAAMKELASFCYGDKLRNDTKETRETIRLYEMAAAAGDIDAKLKLVHIYEGLQCEDDADDVKHDRLCAKARTLLEECAAEKLPKAMYEMYLRLEAENSQPAANELLVEAADAKHVVAMRTLGCLYAKGEKGFMQSGDLAIKYLEGACNAHDSRAMSLLGYIYCEGKLVKQELVKGIELHRCALRDRKTQNKLSWAQLEIYESETECLEKIEESAKNGNSDALYILANSYMTGIGHEKNDDLAKEYFCRASEGGNAFAGYRVGRLFSLDSIVNEIGLDSSDILEIPNARERFLYYAGMGSLKAKFNLAMCYIQGRDTAIDCDRALALFAEIAQSKDSNGYDEVSRYLEYAWGKCLELSGAEQKEVVSTYLKGVKGELADADPWLVYKLGKARSKNVSGAFNADLEAAQNFFVVAAKNGEVRAKYRCGRYYAKHNMYDYARECFTEAAQAGYAQAQREMAETYRYGKYAVVKDIKTACEWYKKAAKQGDVFSMTMLGDIYNDERRHMYNPYYAMYFYDMACKNGHAKSCIKLAELYEYGIDNELFTPNGDMAACTYMRLADANAAVQYKLAQFYDRKAQQLASKACSDNAEDNERLHDAEKKAMYHYGKSAQKIPAAWISLGDGYRLGKGVDVNCKKAALCYEKAIECYRQSKGDGQYLASYKLGNMLYFGGEGIEANEELAFCYLRRAATKGVVEAQIMLAKHLYIGNPEKQMEMFAKAEDGGSKEAAYELAVYHLEGKGGHREDAIALKYCVEAVKRGHIQAHYLLEKLSPESALSVYNQIAFASSTTDTGSVGEAQEHGSKHDNARHLIENETGCVYMAQYRLAEMIRSKSPKKARKLLKMALAGAQAAHDTDRVALIGEAVELAYGSDNA